MCEIELTLCSKCEFVIESTFELCDEGKRGKVCVGPNTPSGRPFLEVSTNIVSGIKQVDMSLIAPSVTFESTCRSCSRSRPRSRC